MIFYHTDMIYMGKIPNKYKQLDHKKIKVYHSKKFPKKQKNLF